ARPLARAPGAGRPDARGWRLRLCTSCVARYETDANVIRRNPNCARVRTGYAHCDRYDGCDGCHPRERELAHAAHRAALDCEEHAASVYARRIDRGVQLARAATHE